MTKLNEKSSAPAAIVTGGNSGIGEAIVKMLATRGYTVIVAGRRQEANERIADELKDLGAGEIIPFTADVSQEADCLKLIHQTTERQGRLDLLVNNAGIGGMDPILQSKSEDFDRVMRTNLYSAYWLSREAFRVMKDQAQGSDFAVRGSILNTASVCGVDAWAGTAAYSASKHGMMGLTRAMADEGAEHFIRVAAICPAMVSTPMTGCSGAEYIAPYDIAHTVAYLLDLSSAAWPVEIVIPRRGSD